MWYLIGISVYIFGALFLVLFDYFKYFTKPVYLRNDKFYGKRMEWRDYKIILWGWLITAILPFVMLYTWVRDLRNRG